MAKDSAKRDADGFESLTYDIVSWDTEGQSVEGVIEDISPFTEGDFGGESLRYMLRDELGQLKSTVLGGATDKQLAGRIKPGDYIRIIFHGKGTLKDGRPVNKFDVRVRR